ncbi:SDR family oxidoreductase [Magnetovibrio sp.]|uniref:SDR family oxidoreductase n=1 Tax=Magnetovibrio sp. TaxID=2024836 RepID=UPI002F91DCC4
MIFEHKTVFISGANRGIGKALVAALLQRGAEKVYAAARNTATIADYGDTRVVPVALDITHPDQVRAAAEMAADTDILINNAGAATYASAMSGSLDDAKRDMDINCFGTLDMMRAFVPVLESKSDGAIVNVVSIAAFVNFPFLGGYSASKAALFSLTQGARLELAAKGIAVHSVNPGPIDTDMTKDIAMDKTSPDVTARAILDGLQAGQLDFSPDPTGQTMFETWRKDYRALEGMVADMMAGA